MGVYFHWKCFSLLDIFHSNKWLIIKIQVQYQSFWLCSYSGFKIFIFLGLALWYFFLLRSNASWHHIEGILTDMVDAYWGRNDRDQTQP